jgi:polygalacturonase
MGAGTDNGLRVAAMNTRATSVLVTLLASGVVFATARASIVCDVRQFGARGDGATFDTEAIQKALDVCGKAGGGTVRFIHGVYYSRPLTLHSRTTLLLEAGATLLASTNQNDFLKTPGDWRTAKSGDFIPFISGDDLTDVTFAGKGTIDGNGAAWWEEAEKARQRVSGYVLPRPRLMNFNRCKNLRLVGIKLVNSPSSHLLFTDSEDVTIEKVTIVAPAGSANTDGINPSNSRNVTIAHCTIDTGDDNIAIKSSKRVAGREFACENISVIDCDFLHGHGMSIGSATAGGIHHVVVKNCRFENTDNGLRIKSGRDRGGRVEDISYSDITMKNVHPAISFVGYYQYSTNDKYPKNDPGQPMTATTPIFCNFHISNLNASCTQDAGLIVGLPESPLTNVFLDNVHIAAQTGLTIVNAAGIQFKNVEISVQKGPPFVMENVRVKGPVSTNEKR